MDTIYNQKLLEFYKSNKSEVLSCDQIISISSSLYSLYPYGTYNKNRVIEISENENILFGLKSGLLFTDIRCYYFFIHGNDHSVTKLEYSELLFIRFEKKLFGEKVVFKNFKEGFKKFEIKLFKKIKNLIEECENKIKKDNENKVKESNERDRINEEKRVEKLSKNQLKTINELDKDGNGEVDVVEGYDFNTLLKKHQKSIVEVDRNYVQQFVKVSSYLKTKKGNIQSIFNSIKDTPNQEVLNEYVEILKDEIHTYNLILFNSLNMIVSLVEDDMITFYEIHEMFDTLNMFDSKHEKDVSQRLTNIGDGLESLMYEIRDMGNQISNSIQELSYVTEESNEQLSNQLSEIDSTMKVGNLINTINTYQNYKNNKNTKNLRG
jgi:hypothetical protein